ncbi:hypothetical protein GGI25_003298 [Coemansia spiralis]|uniref:Uncharacterized protein n=2 Tax=Coemansia TaxID=4863 RepID=A0A9W8KWM4_9FUNG|nr:hypothetical protein BX070DRAFT_233557 [Coemansia spiralis]KAJ1992814.1 hypothetical protein EDC05_002598 [Coemansia umbellata]KAJ2622529.1 hypothetical protein GGI26_003128 [Coemansia sp. RSA 1358]KAJ2677078.1 hypothetical protein GGI25_003298 [Coemansia spiralis]
MRYHTTKLAFFGLFAVISNVLASPDVAGTRTIVISLATGDRGQIIPFVLPKNTGTVEPPFASSNIPSEDASNVEDPASNSASTADPSSIDPIAGTDAAESSNVLESGSAGTQEAAQSTAVDSDSDSEDNSTSGAASEDTKATKKSAAAACAIPGAVQMIAISACIYVALAKERF